MSSPSSFSLSCKPSTDMQPVKTIKWKKISTDYFLIELIDWDDQKLLWHNIYVFILRSLFLKWFMTLQFFSYFYIWSHQTLTGQRVFYLQERRSSRKRLPRKRQRKVSEFDDVFKMWRIRPWYVFMPEWLPSWWPEGSSFSFFCIIEFLKFLSNDLQLLLG